MEQPLTVLQAADRAQLHRQTIADALRAGTLHGGQRKVRGTWRIQQECLDAWLIDVPCPHYIPKVIVGGQAMPASGGLSVSPSGRLAVAA